MMKVRKVRDQGCSKQCGTHVVIARSQSDNGRFHHDDDMMTMMTMMMMSVV